MFLLSNPIASRLRILAVKDDPMFNIHELIDDAKCFRTVREIRWPDGITCPFSSSNEAIKYGRDDTQTERHRYQCHDCSKRFNDLTGTIFAGRHQFRRNWITCLELMA